MKHKILFFLLMVFPMTIVAQEPVEVNGIYYLFDSSKKTAEVTNQYGGGFGISGYSGKKVIPSTVTYKKTEYKVTSIGDYAFSNYEPLTYANTDNTMQPTKKKVRRDTEDDGVTSVTIPNSVKTIGTGAFYYCKKLTAITLPTSLTTIGDLAFNNCGLTAITIPQTVTSIGNAAFSICEALGSITVKAGNTKYDSRNSCNALIETSTNTLITGCYKTVIPNDVVAIADNAFCQCTKLTKANIPGSVTTIGQNAFSKCSSLTTVSIPKSVTSIASGAFNECSSLKTITVEDGNTQYDSRNNCNAIIETSSNKLLFGCKGTIIPEGVVSIGAKAFYGCAGLPTIVIPSTVTSIGKYAFNCSDLTSIVIPSSVLMIGEAAFSSCYQLETVVCKNPNVLSDFFLCFCQEAEWGPFYETGIMGVTLYVPNESVYRYQNALDELEEQMIDTEGMFSSIQSISNMSILTVKNCTREYGSANPKFEYTTEGAKPTGKPTISCTAKTTSAAGVYPITISKGTLTGDFILVNGTLTVNKAPLDIYVKPCIVSQGDAMPQWEYVYSGFKNGESESVLTTKPNVSCEATSTATVGDFLLSVSGASAQNYEMLYSKSIFRVETKSNKGMDINKDGDVDVTDIMLIVDYILGR